MKVECEETQLVVRALEGDRESFSEIINLYATKVLKTASRYTNSQDELDDLAQEALIAIWKGLRTYQFKAPFEHWLMKVTIRVCYQHLRKHRNTKERETDFEKLDESTLIHKSHEDTLEALSLVQYGLGMLEHKQRLVLTMTELEGYSTKEVSELTGWTRANVKVIAFRGRKKLKAIFKRQGYEVVDER